MKKSFCDKCGVEINYNTRLNDRMHYSPTGSVNVQIYFGGSNAERELCLGCGWIIVEDAIKRINVRAEPI